MSSRFMNVRDFFVNFDQRKPCKYRCGYMNTAKEREVHEKTCLRTIFVHTKDHKFKVRLRVTSTTSAGTMFRSFYKHFRDRFGQNYPHSKHSDVWTDCSSKMLSFTVF